MDNRRAAPPTMSPRLPTSSTLCSDIAEVPWHSRRLTSLIAMRAISDATTFRRRPTDIPRNPFNRGRIARSIHRHSVMIYRCTRFDAPNHAITYYFCFSHGEKFEKLRDVNVTVMRYTDNCNGGHEYWPLTANRPHLDRVYRIDNRRVSPRSRRSIPILLTFRGTRDARRRIERVEGRDVASCRRKPGAHIWSHTRRANPSTSPHNGWSWHAFQHSRHTLVRTRTRDSLRDAPQMHRQWNDDHD